MKKTLAILMSLAAFAIASCTAAASPAKIDASAGRSMMTDDPSIVLVDVRTSEEYAAGHIPGAILIPLSELAAEADGQLPDKDAKIIVYCRSGNRSAQAAELLDGLGYTRIYDMGGIVDWPYDVVSD